MEAATVRVGVITVTHESRRFFGTYLRALENQTLQPDKVVLVDSGSTDKAFLDAAVDSKLNVQVILESNVGFSVGNNIGWKLLRDCDYIVFLNPDAFLAPDALAHAVEYLERSPHVGMLSPTLLRFDIAAQKPLNCVDSTGVVRGWRGVTIERDAEKPISVLSKYTGPNEVPWLCAAAIVARQTALESVLQKGDELFDESFFMYKEDTDLSWRIRRAGWKNVHHPGLIGYHCRGWKSRRSFSRKTRLLSARNDVRMCLKNRSPFVIVASLKLMLAALFNL